MRVRLRTVILGIALIALGLGAEVTWRRWASLRQRADLHAAEARRMRAAADGLAASGFDREATLYRQAAEEQARLRDEALRRW